MKSAPRLSVIVPVRNGGATLEACLRGLLPSIADLAEILVVDDGSTDNSAAIANALGVRVVANPRGRGPAAARNAGAALTTGGVLLFIDADVVVQASTVLDVVAVLDAETTLAGVFGSYDDRPHEPNFLSQYKNLLHHFTHQTGRAASGSFWGGCGALRRQAFEAVGGFDEQRYRRASIGDIELGLRMARSGRRIRLDARLQVKHLKRWTAFSLLKAEIVDRAYPWSRLIVSTGPLPDDLNLRRASRWSAGLVGLVVLAGLYLALGARRFYGVPAFELALAAGVMATALVLVVNRQFYGFLLRARGPLFTLRAIPLHLCYFFYSGVTFVLCWLWEQGRRDRSRHHKVDAPRASSA